MKICLRYFSSKKLILIVLCSKIFELSLDGAFSLVAESEHQILSQKNYFFHNHLRLSLWNHRNLFFQKNIFYLPEKTGCSAVRIKIPSYTRIVADKVVFRPGQHQQKTVNTKSLVQFTVWVRKNWQKLKCKSATPPKNKLKLGVRLELRLCGGPFMKHILHYKKYIQSKVSAVPGLSLHPSTAKNPKKQLQHLKTSHKNQRDIVIWHCYLLNISLSPHKSNGNQRLTPVIQLEFLEPFRKQVSTLVYALELLSFNSIWLLEFLTLIQDHTFFQPSK